MDADLAAFGIRPPERIEEDAQDEGEAFEVWPENWEIVQIFQLLDDAWRRNAYTGRTEGLRWEAAESVMRMMAVGDTKAVFLGLKLMSAAALPLLNRRAG